MQVYLADLLQLEAFSNARILVHQDKSEHPILRPYLCLSPSEAEGLSGGELLFVPLLYPAFSNDFKGFLVLCSQKSVGGLVLICDWPLDGAFQEERIISKAKELALPVMKLSVNSDISLLMLEVSRLLEQRSRSEEENRRFLENVLFERYRKDDKIIRMAQFYSIPLMPYYFISILGNSLNTGSAEFTRQLIPAALRQIKELNKSVSCHIIPAAFQDTILVLTFAPQEVSARSAMEALSQMCQNLRVLYLNAEFSLSFSRVHERLTELPDSYREASQTLLMLRSANYPSYILRYEELGITRLLFELTDTTEVKRYCMENLKPILDYDKEHSSDLLYTLKGYFMNNRHLVNTSNALYVHRNTLVYRLSIIKELLGRDLDNAMTALELFNSILIYEFLQSREDA